MPDYDVPVLIVGGSLVGMSTALLLAHQGVPALAVEHHRGTAIHPRAAQISQRTMEVFRRVGVEQIVREKSSEQFVQDGAIMAVETLAGRELKYFIPNLNEGVRDVSPCERVFISQSLIEPLLKQRAEELGARLRFGADVIDFDASDDGVTVKIQDRDNGRTETVRARYMVAADGARSRIRERLSIKTRGRGVFSNSVTIYFRANVAPLLRGRNLSVIYVSHPQLRGFFRFEKPFNTGFLAINALGDPNNPITDVATGLTDEKCLEYIRLALGTEDINVEIENVMPWKATAEYAERLQQGPIFIAGDAAHTMPPNGGFGGNTGIQDADNLAWKLVKVLDGTAGEALLSTYEVERAPVGEFTTEQAYSRYVTRTAPYLGTDTIQPVADDLDVEIGYIYRSAAVVSDGTAEGRVHESPRESRGRPGTRATHVWLQRDGRRISTLDLCDGRNFALLAGVDASAWSEATQAAAARLGVQVDVRRVRDDEAVEPARGFTAAYGIEPTGAVLVRPDGFVGWRAKTGDGASPDAVEKVLRRLLCR